MRTSWRALECPFFLIAREATRSTIPGSERENVLELGSAYMKTTSKSDVKGDNRS